MTARRAIPHILPARPWLVVPSLLLAVIVAGPVIGLIIIGFTGGGEAWRSFATAELFGYLANSLALGLGTAVGTALIGVPAAWLVTMCSFPGRRILEWALVLPLAAPAYIIAYAYADFLQHAGPVQSWLRAVTGWGARDYWFPEIRSLSGAILVFSLVLYPYIYLLVRATLIEQSVCVLEASRSLGQTPLSTFFRVALPLARPAIVAGAALAVMEALADFGAVKHFGVQTFTTAIYQAFAFLSDRALAARLAFVLLVIVLTLLALEHWQRGRATSRATTGYVRPLPRFRLGPGHSALALAATLLPVFLGALLPAGLLLTQALEHGHNLLSERYFLLIRNTVSLGLIAGAIAVLTALLLAYAARLSRSRMTRAAMRLATLGYILPGSIIAIGILIPLARLDLLLNESAGRLLGLTPGLVFTGTILALLYAYVVRFLAVALRTAETSLARITPEMDDAAATLGARPARILRRVHLPMMRASLLTAGLIVFVEVVKELPATLILRPFNFDTLAIQAYRLASDERLAEASTASLAILVLGIIPVLVLTRTISRSRVSQGQGGTR